MQKTSDLIWQDTQHQALFRLIDMIQQEPFDRGVLFELQRYAEHHFVLEEAYMEILRYPDMQRHIETHNRFRDEIDQLVRTPTLMDSELRKSLSIFLTEWLKRHVFGMDKHFEAFVLAADIK